MIQMMLGGRLAANDEAASGAVSGNDARKARRVDWNDIVSYLLQPEPPLGRLDDCLACLLGGRIGSGRVQHPLQELQSLD